MTIGNQSGLIIWLVYFLAKAGIAAFLLAGLYFVLSRIPERGKKFLEGVFSDNGSPSFSRVATAVLLTACIWWDTYFLYKLKVLPDFGGQIAFIGLLYGLNVASKFSPAATVEAQKKDSVPPSN
jgi:hypothetical protein